MSEVAEQADRFAKEIAKNLPNSTVVGAQGFEAGSGRPGITLSLGMLSTFIDAKTDPLDARMVLAEQLRKALRLLGDQIMEVAQHGKVVTPEEQAWKPANPS